VTKFESKLINGFSASEVTNLRLKKEMGITSNAMAQYMVYKTKLDGKTYYCCWSGGRLVDGDASLTQVGQAALETLISLPVGNETLVLQELRVGQTELRDKVKATFRKLPSGSKVCFFGDMAGELDGKMHQAFNVTGTIDISE